MTTEQILLKYRKKKLLVIAIDPSIRSMGYARLCTEFLNINAEKAIPLPQQLDPNIMQVGSLQPLALGTFRNTTDDNIFERGKDQLSKMRAFVEKDIEDFAFPGSYFYQKMKFSSIHNKAATQVYIVIETPTHLYTGAKHGNAYAVAKMTLIIGMLIGAFPDAILRPAIKGTTLKRAAREILIARDHESMREFWEGANEHEIDAYMTLEWFLENEFDKHDTLK